MPHRSNHLPLLSLASLLLISCGGSDNDAKEKSVDHPTYTSHIASIFNEHCNVCHTPGGIAPFALDSYINAVTADPNGLNIKRAVSNRSMPPWLADNSGSCKTFQHARWLEDSQIETISKWVDQGMPQGDSIAEEFEPPDMELNPAQGEIKTLSLQSPYNPSGHPEHPQDDYRCFVLDPELQQDRQITAYAVKPGNEALVHHVVLFALKSDNADNEALSKDANGQGYTCFGGSGIQGDQFTEVSTIAGWAPGVKATHFPANTGLTLHAQHKLVMQIHYNLENGEGYDQTQIELQFASSPVQSANLIPIADLDLQLPPGEQHVATKTSWKIPDNWPTTRLHGLFPHMHTLGNELSVTKIAGMREECLIDITKWDFEWQQFYFYSSDEQSVDLSAGQTLELSCSYDTSERSEPVNWGDGTRDEMCLSYLYISGLEP